MYEKYLKTWQPRATQKQSGYAAIIIENRHYELIDFLIRNTLFFTPEQVNIHVLCSNQNFEFIVQKLDAIQDIIITVLPELSEIDKIGYSRLLKTKSFWEKIPAEKLLIFQWDTLLINQLELKWFDYPYLGAPWFKEEFVETFPYHSLLDKSQVNKIELRRSLNPKIFEYCPHSFGNGGLSIRSRSKMLEICDQYPDDTDSPEDIYFSCFSYYDLNSAPEIEIARQFCTETWFCPESIGVHSPWNYLTLAQQSYFLERHHKNLLSYFTLS